MTADFTGCILSQTLRRIANGSRERTPDDRLRDASRRIDAAVEVEIALGLLGRARGHGRAAQARDHDKAIDLAIIVGLEEPVVVLDRHAAV